MSEGKESSLLVYFEPGELIFAADEEGHHAYIIESGQVDIFVTTTGKDVSLKTLTQGDVFGEMAVIDASPRSASARALTETCCVVISRAQISDRIDASDPVVKLLVSRLLDHIRSLNTGVSQAARPTAPEISSEPSSPFLPHQPVLEKMRLESELLDAIATDAFIPHYQPLVDLETEEILGFEFLIRWKSPTRGWVSPGLFIDTAEETSLIRPIGQWVIENACADLNRFNQALSRSFVASGKPRTPLFISVNVSARQFQAPQFNQELLEILQRHQIPHSQIKLEVTERVLMEGASAINIIQQCRQLGFHLALDDFGTGFSSLTYLAKFEIDSLKIDQYFVRQMLTHPRTLALMKHILAMTQDLGMVSVAEGVETQQEFDILRRLGCQIGQGYLFGKPLPFESAKNLLLENYRRPSAPTGPLLSSNGIENSVPQQTGSRV
ncbi:EAL domain-containing protein [Acaryochloris sp. IP29b_bin.137]|uniref:EAL domain-containing protein n=1 Tax=Acaryochloris sp. IP29b_bin.137 TaxID=2969217 RepID=UPI002609C1C6|nr:EAL domain-containing protein [Acaryochloris sp. IP29b_bin.137]